MSSESVCAGRFLGEFRELGHGRTDGPSLRDCVRREGEAYEADLVRYLRAGSLLAATTSRVHDILSSGNELIGGLHLLTDGEWFWYTDLAHYVEHYHVPLDARFVDHACDRGWRPPQLSDAELARIADAFFPDDGSAPVVADGGQ
ncbi:hypothetical protein ABT404_39430 [Streptomyces hyaluromycini]|uniref:Uncharacterized protein n=1 Tax=Streptomyces hyaluromycini TaxID=1377993 RepID=A0ABV1X8X0_9ACTN